MKTLTDHMQELESKKRTLENSVDRLNEECTKLKAQGPAAAAGGDAKKAVESQLQAARDAHTKQVGGLRDEIDEKNKRIEDLKM